MVVEVKQRHSSRVQARKFLERQLMTLQAGDPLPPVRILMKQCRIGRSRLESLFNEFVAEGLVERRSRQGVFKLGQQQSDMLAPFVDLVICEQFGEGTFFRELIEALTREGGRRYQGIRMHEFENVEPLSAYEMLARRSDVRACILVNLHRPEITTILDHHQVAWVSLYPAANYHSRQSITPSSQMTQVQLDHLWELGHTRIAYLHSVYEASPSWIQLQRREAYYRLVAERGLMVKPHWVVYADGREAGVFTAFEEIFSQPPYPTAVIVRDPQLSAAYRFLELRGLCVGKDFSVIGTDDLANAAEMHPAATTVRNPREVAARMAMETLGKIMTKQQIQDEQCVPVKLVVRQSTGPLVQTVGVTR